MENLKKIFYSLLNKYNVDEVDTEKYWIELDFHYNEAHRHYHTWQHIVNMYHELSSAMEVISDEVLFALFYHDAVYDVIKTNNEMQSAVLMKKRLAHTEVPIASIDKIEHLILATSNHQLTNNLATNLFLDADIAILGASTEQYNLYANNIRKEYAIYIDAAYNAGRIAILESFLKKEFIYSTDFFREKYEAKARENLKNELEYLKHK